MFQKRKNWSNSLVNESKVGILKRKSIMINIIIPTNNMSILVIIENTNIIISIYYVNLSANSRTYYCEILDKHSRQENK